MHITGTEPWTHGSLADSISQAMGSKITYEQITCDDYDRLLGTKGHTASEAHGLCEYLKQADENALAIVPSDDYRIVCGTQPTSLDMYSKEVATMLRQ